MIRYGSTISKFIRLDISQASPFTIRGAIKQRFISANTGVTFPIYGAVTQQLVAPKHFAITGSVIKHVLAPVYFKRTGAVLKYTTQGLNISGLVIPNIKQVMHFQEPAYKYDIYPYERNDINKVLNYTSTFQIVGNWLLLDSLPNGAITVVPFDRLQIDAGEIKNLTVKNTIPDKAEFLNITVSGGFLFSLTKTGPWSSELSIVDNFYVKAPELQTDGSDFTKEIIISAVAFPRG